MTLARDLVQKRQCNIYFKTVLIEHGSSYICWLSKREKKQTIGRKGL